MPTSIKPSRGAGVEVPQRRADLRLRQPPVRRDGVYDRFAEKLQQAVEKLRIGDGLQDGVTTGPLIDEKAVAKVEEHIADAIAKGAKVVTGGKPHATGGNFFQPTIRSTFPTAPKWRKRDLRPAGPAVPL